MTIKINTVKEKTDSELYNGCVCLKTLAYTNLSSYQKTVITKHWAAWNLLQSHWHQHIIRFVFNPYVLGNNVHFVLSVVLMDVKSVKNVIWVVSLLCNSFHQSVSKRSMLTFTYMFWILHFLFFLSFLITWNGDGIDCMSIGNGYSCFVNQNFYHNEFSLLSIILSTIKYYLH